MPKWAGKWKGGRYYLDERGRKVFFIERLRRSVKLPIPGDEEIALGELARFLRDPVEFCRPPPEPEAPKEAVYITTDRINLYMASIRKASQDHRKARRSYLLDWANYRGRDGRPLDLYRSDKREIRTALASFGGGYKGRVEALNAFARFIVRERDQGIAAWVPFVNPYDTAKTRADRVAYDLEDLQEAYARLVAGSALAEGDNARFKGACHPRTADVFLVRAATGMHQTEIDQLVGAPIFKGPLPDKGVGIRVLEGDHLIRGVLQVRQKSRERLRKSVTQEVLDAALRLREGGIPNRTSIWEVFAPIVPSNLRHTWETLAEDCGELIPYKRTGVDRSVIRQQMGHSPSSTMIEKRYNKSQVPPLILLPLGFP